MFFAFTSFMAKENENGQERTEQPTSKRLQDAREKGQVCKSIEVSTALLFLVTVIAFYLYIPTVAKRLGSVVGSYLGNLSMWNGTSVSVVSIFRHGVVELGIMTLPLLVLFSSSGSRQTSCRSGSWSVPRPSHPSCPRSTR
jgi:flagellar biosynthetic protein FlhB